MKTNRVDMKKKISILITCFNKEHSIQQTIESSLNQSISNSLFEILVIDDCSTDNSSQILSSIKGINFHRNIENQGVLQSVFIGLNKAQGEIIILLDGDDILVPNAVEIISEFLDKHPNSALYTNCKRFDKENLAIHQHPIDKYQITRKFNNPLNITRFNKTGTSAIAFYKNNLLDEQENVPPVLIQDHIIGAFLARQVNKFYFIDAMTHIAINWDSNTHITSNTPQMEHDRIEFFWQCIQTERRFKNSIFDIYFRIVLIKKIYKRNKKYKIGIKLGIFDVVNYIVKINSLKNIKDECMKAFREKYSIKFYG